MSTPTNQFLNGTARSNYAANTFFRDALSRLSAYAVLNSIIKMLYDRTLPLYAVWERNYLAWIGSKGTYAGKTDEWESIADELRKTKYQIWRASIITAGILPDSPVFKTLLPNGSKYFHGGRYERRTAEVKTFLEQLSSLSQANFNSLQWTVIEALKTDVQAFYDRMFAIRNAQQEIEKSYDDAPIELEDARIALCIMLYRNLGILMDTYPEEPERVNSFYEWNLLKAKSKRKNSGNTLSNSAEADDEEDMPTL